MDENILRKNKFKSPDINPRYFYNNTHRINNYFLNNKNSDIYDNIIETNINNTNYCNNFRPIPNYNNNNGYNYDLDPEHSFSSDINNFFLNLNNNVSLMKQENITLKNNIKKYRKKLLSKDREIDNYKQKVKALLNQVQDKNYDLDIKKNTIIKLSEEKEIFYKIHSPKNNINSNNNEIYSLKIQLQQQYKEKEQYKKKILYLNNFIQKMNKNNIKQIKKNNLKNNKNESEKSSEYKESTNNGNNNHYINRKNIYNDNELIMNSFCLKIQGFSNKQILNNHERNNFIDLSKEFEGYKKNKEIELNQLKRELEEKNNLLKKREKMLNDYILNIKTIKEENNNLKNNLNKTIKELSEYKIKYEDDKNMDTEDKKIELDLITRDNKELKDKLSLIEEEKINNERKIEELNEDIENLKENIDNCKKKLKEKDDIINKTNEEINNLKEKQKQYENINEENINLKLNLEKINKELEKSKIQIKELTNDNNELNKKIVTIEDNYNNSKKEINDIKILNAELIEKLRNNKSIETNKNNNDNINNENDNNSNAIELKKENEVLQKRVIQLNELIEELNIQSNELNIKYANIKKENTNLKEASQAILDKQKQQIEKKDLIENISPETHYIITKKTYNKLIWYLISIINPNDKSLSKNSGYENYKWVTELSIPKSQLGKFNKFEDDDTKINDLYSYIKKMQTKLEQKEEEINKKSYENQKLNDKLQNKSSNIKVGKLFLTKVLNNDKGNNNNVNKSNSNQNTIKNNANSYLGGNNGDMEKYKNLLDIVNDYDEREKKYQNEISKLKSQLKDRENLQSGMKDIKDIPFDSDFIGDDLEDKKVIELIPNENNNAKKKEKNNEKDDGNFLNILNDVPGEDSDLDEVKGLKNLNNYLKKIIREKDKILNDLLEQVKEVIKELKWSVKTNKIVTKILTILGYTPEVIKIVTDNKKGFNFDFNLELKK